MQITSKELSEKVGVGMSRIRQRVNEIKSLGLAEKKAGRWFFDPSAIFWMKDNKPHGGMRVHGGPTEYEIHGCRIRGLDWTLIREPGQGTYARIAAMNIEDDEDFVVEEYSDPERRAIWDRMSPPEAAAAAYADIMESVPRWGFEFHTVDHGDDDKSVWLAARVNGDETRNIGCYVTRAGEVVTDDHIAWCIDNDLEEMGLAPGSEMAEQLLDAWFMAAKARAVEVWDGVPFLDAIAEG